MGATSRLVRRTSAGRRVTALTLGLLLVAVAALASILAIETPALPRPLPILALSATIVLLSRLPPIHVELRRQAAEITGGDAALVVGLVLLDPTELVTAAVLAEVMLGLTTRQPARKRWFNLASILASSALGALIHLLLSPGDPLRPGTWLAALAGLTTITLADTLAVSAVLRLTDEHTTLVGVLRPMVPTLLVNLALSAPIGILGLITIAVAPAALLLILPAGLGLHFSARAIAEQRTDRLRLARLGEASSALTGLIDGQQLLSQVTECCRGLVTGVAAIGVLERRNGARKAVLVDDHGSHGLGSTPAAALLALVGDNDVATHPPGALPGPVRRILPEVTLLLTVARGTEQGGRMVVAVAREFGGEPPDDRLTEILTAYLSHAASAADAVDLHTELGEALARERHLNRSKDEFVATVSHELLTPLTGMFGAIVTLEATDERLGPAERTQLLALARRQGQRLQQLVEDLIDVAADTRDNATATDPAHHPVELPLLVGELTRRFATRLSAPPVVRVQLDGSPLVTDRALLVRILEALCDNAAKYAPNAAVELSIAQRPEWITFTVRDHGPGIPEPFEDRIFAPFVQGDQSTTRARGGTGIGLHLAARRAQRLGGTLAHERPEDGGARFVLSLPVDGPAPAQPALTEV